MCGGGVAVGGFFFSFLVNFWILFLAKTPYQMLATSVFTY